MLGRGSKSVRLVLGVLLFFIITYGLFSLLLGDSLENRLSDLPATWLGAGIIAALLILDILIPVPASLVMVMSGILFGGLVGGLVAVLGAVTGAVIHFLISRRVGRVGVAQWLGQKEYEKFSTKMQAYGSVLIVMSRMVPLLMEAASALAGISKMRLKRFVVLNVVGFVPVAFFYSIAGAYYRHEPENIVLILGVGFLVPLLIWLLITRVWPKKTDVGEVDYS